MEKLIELLNEFRPTVSCANFKEYYEFIDDDIYLIREWMDWEEEQFPMYVCYKKGNFIQWLVDNDKIDLLRLDNRIALSEFNKVERCLMALSIQDNPIEFLISILK